MKIHILEHVAHEDAGIILDWASNRKYPVSKTAFYQTHHLPEIDSFDMLVIMGGPMNIYQHENYPWLMKEKLFITESIKSHKLVLGICLGAQLVADCLGAKVTQNPHQEIGWFPIRWTSSALVHPLFSGLESPMTVFHWHGDTFSLPEGALHVATSEACQNQAFLYQNRVLGLQFHLEAKEDTIRGFLHHGQGELKPKPYIQNQQLILSKFNNVPTINTAMITVLDRMAQLNNNL